MFCFANHRHCDKFQINSKNSVYYNNKKVKCSNNNKCMRLDVWIVDYYEFTLKYVIISTGKRQYFF